MPRVSRLFIDPGFSSGWALFQGGKLLAHGAFKTTGSDAKRYWEIFKKYHELLQASSPEEVHVEGFPKSKVHVKLLNSIGLYFAVAGSVKAEVFQDVWASSWQKWAGFSKKKKEWGIGEKFRGEIDSEDQLSAVLMGLWFTRELRAGSSGASRGDLKEVRLRRQSKRKRRKKLKRKRKVRKLSRSSKG